ncbi:MAG: hypothetical protein DMG25_17250, partial [Acidobacteria bacterium]
MEERDYRALSEQDLQELLDPSDKELRRFLKTGNGKYAVYQERLIAVCLCQGAAKHFLDQQTGVKDISRAETRAYQRGATSPPGQNPMSPVAWGQAQWGNLLCRSRPDTLASEPSPEARANVQ